MFAFIGGLILGIIGTVLVYKLRGDKTAASDVQNVENAVTQEIKKI